MTDFPTNAQSIVLPAIYFEGANFEDVGFIEIHADATVHWRSAAKTSSGEPVRTWVIKDSTTGSGAHGRNRNGRGAYRFGSHRYARVFRYAVA